MLPHVVDAVGRGRVPIFVDGGIRRGTDVLKVGANADMASCAPASHFAESPGGELMSHGSIHRSQAVTFAPRHPTRSP